jgi:hypothetical protein
MMLNICLSMSLCKRSCTSKTNVGLHGLSYKRKLLSLQNLIEYSTNKNDPDAFKASTGWISNALKREDLVSIKLCGEAVDLTDAEAAELINPFWTHLAELM